MDEPEDKDQMKRLGVFITLPFVLSVPPVLGWFIGSYLDRTFDTKPYLMYVLIIVGFIAAIREFLRIIKRFGNET